MAHRDIKLDNILSVDGQLKLVDFGFACSTLNPMSGGCGSLMFMAPELFPPGVGETEQQLNGHSADMWACGVVFYCLMTAGHFPFTGRIEREIIIKIKRGIYHTGNCSPLAQNLLQRMLCVNN